jgi:hypothetical protein
MYKLATKDSLFLLSAFSSVKFSAILFLDISFGSEKNGADLKNSYRFVIILDYC